MIGPKQHILSRSGEGFTQGHSIRVHVGQAFNLIQVRAKTDLKILWLLFIKMEPRFPGVQSTIQSYKVADSGKMPNSTAVLINLDCYHGSYKLLLQYNRFPIYLINRVIKNFLDKQYINKATSPNVPKFLLLLSFPYLGSRSVHLKKKLKKFFGSIYP